MCEVGHHTRQAAGPFRLCHADMRMNNLIAGMADAFSALDADVYPSVHCGCLAVHLQGFVLWFPHMEWAALGLLLSS